MKKAVILEDNPAGVSNLRNLLAQTCEGVEVIAAAGSVKEGLQLLRTPERQPDIAFLDIELEDGHAFDLLDQLDEINFEVIFVTAFDKYAQQACNYGSIGYIEKPIDADQLKAAVERVRPGKKYWARKQIEVFESHFFTHPNPAGQMAVHATDGWYFFQIPEILYLQGEGNCTRFHLKNGRKFLACRTIGEYDMLLQPLHFYRIHKTYIININEIEKVTTRRGCFAHLYDGSRLGVSKRRRPYFFAFLKKWGNKPGGGWANLDGDADSMNR